MADQSPADRASLPVSHVEKSMHVSCPCKFVSESPDFGKKREFIRKGDRSILSPKKNKAPKAPKFDWEATREESLAYAEETLKRYENCAELSQIITVLRSNAREKWKNAA